MSMSKVLAETILRKYPEQTKNVTYYYTQVDRDTYSLNIEGRIVDQKGFNDYVSYLNGVIFHIAGIKEIDIVLEKPLHDSDPPKFGFYVEFESMRAPIIIQTIIDMEKEDGTPN